MTFTKNSGLVKIWLGRVQSGASTIEQVPNIFNLREIVKELADADQK